MEPQNQRETTKAGREMLSHCLRGVNAATRHLQLVLQTGTHAEFLEAVELWEQSVKLSQEATSTCKGLLDDEVEAWLKG